jgi:hypothetical protein
MNELKIRMISRSNYRKIELKSLENTFNCAFEVANRARSISHRRSEIISRKVVAMRDFCQIRRIRGSSPCLFSFFLLASISPLSLDRLTVIFHVGFPRLLFSPKKRPNRPMNGRDSAFISTFAPT